MIYLDANATEPLRPAAREAVLRALDVTGNPASVHAAGRAARHILEDAREALAARFGARPANLVFTSGGTEANALAIAGLGNGRRLLISAIEHDAVRAAAPGASTLPVSQDGVLRLDTLAAALRDGPPALLCLMLANNETGAIQPVAEAAALCQAHGALLHVDAVQAAGRLPLDLARLGADSLAISGHKFGGPKGAGALLLAAERSLPALIAGGGQERGRRGGTPALPAIAGMAAAAQASEPEAYAALAPLRDAIEAAAQEAGAVAIAAAAPRLANTACLALPGMRAESQVIALDLAGFAVSAGAACSSGKVNRSHVLAAMELGARSGEAIRVSLPWNATKQDADAFIAAYAAMASRARRPQMSLHAS